MNAATAAMEHAHNNRAPFFQNRMDHFEKCLKDPHEGRWLWCHPTLRLSPRILPIGFPALKSGPDFIGDPGRNRACDRQLGRHAT